MLTKSPIYPWRTLASFLVVLLLMPLGHAFMILMEHMLSTTALHYCAFAMGALGMVIVIVGVFVSGDTRQTIFGLAGGLLFWTGWVEFLFSYFAWRFGVHCDLLGSGTVQTISQYADGVATSHDFIINGAPIDSFERADLKALRGSRPEYLIMPATFGFWMMFLMLYLFCTTTGCRFFSWIQRRLRLHNALQLRPMTRIPAMITFLELNLMMWSLYLLLMFCYDPVFLGPSHPVTLTIALGCLAGSIFMLGKQLKIKPWGANIRMAIATVLVFWSFVEIVARNGLLAEIWVDPLNHMWEMSLILALFLLLTLYPLALRLRRRRGSLRRMA